MVNTERRVMVFNFQTPGDIQVCPELHKRMINKLLWHPEHFDQILTVSSDGYMKLFDCKEKVEVLSLHGNSALYLDAKFDPHDSNIIAASNDNGEIEVRS